MIALGVAIALLMAGMVAIMAGLSKVTVVETWCAGCEKAPIKSIEDPKFYRQRLCVFCDHNLEEILMTPLGKAGDRHA